MKLYRFSPIKNKEELMHAIKYLHKTSFELCFKVLGKYLPEAENLGIFCHYDQEFNFLKEIQTEITCEPDKYNDKYLILKELLEFKKEDEIPGAKYKFFYVRRPDPYRHHVGDIDFVVSKEEFDKLKSMKKTGLRYIQKLDMIELYDPDFDVLVYLSPLMWNERINLRRE